MRSRWVNFRDDLDLIHALHLPRPPQSTGRAYRPHNCLTQARDLRRIRLNWPDAECIRPLAGSCWTCGQAGRLYVFYRIKTTPRTRSRVYCAACGVSTFQKGGEARVSQT